MSQLLLIVAHQGKLPQCGSVCGVICGDEREQFVASEG
jgi:hypothetical protein